MRAAIVGGLGVASALPSSSAPVAESLPKRPFQARAASGFVDVTEPRFGARGDGKSDDAAAIQAAVDSLPGSGGAVYLPPGVYLQTLPITLKDNVAIFGEPNSSILRCEADIVQLKTERTESKSINNISIENLILEDIRILKISGAVTRSRFQVVLTNPIHCRLTRVETRTNTDSKIEWNLSNVGGIHLEKYGVTNSFVNHIEDCWVRQGILWVESTDTQINNGYFWGHTASCAIRIGGNNVRVSNVDLIGSEMNGAIWVPSQYSELAVIGCFFDGSYPEFSTGHGINGALKASVIHANGFWNNSAAGIRLTEADGVSIVGNSFRNNNRSNKNHPDIVLSPQTSKARCSAVVVVGNVFDNTIAKDRGRASCFVEDDAKGNIGSVSNNVFANNSVAAGATGYASTSRFSARGMDAVVQQPKLENISAGAKIASGDVSVPGGAPNVVVQHTLNVRPSVHDISIAPLDGETAARSWWVDQITEQSFRISLAASNTKVARFTWRVQA